MRAVPHSFVPVKILIRFLIHRFVSWIFGKGRDGCQQRLVGPVHVVKKTKIVFVKHLIRTAQTSLIGISGSASLTFQHIGPIRIRLSLKRVSPDLHVSFFVRLRNLNLFWRARTYSRRWLDVRTESLGNTKEIEGGKREEKLVAAVKSRSSRLQGRKFCD